MCYRCTQFSPTFVPAALSEAATYAQQIAYLNKRIDELLARVAVLELDEPPAVVERPAG